MHATLRAAWVRMSILSEPLLQRLATVHATPRAAWVVLSILVVPATGVLAVRHAVGPEARPETKIANARIWLTGPPAGEAGGGRLTVQTMSLVAENGDEVLLSTPGGAPVEVDARDLPGHIALAGAGVVPAGHYSARRLGLGGASRTLPLALTLAAGRELDLVVGVKARPTGATARIASLEQR